MIHVIFKTYATLLLSVGMTAGLLFILGLYWLFKETPTDMPEKKRLEPCLDTADVKIPVEDLKAIAGDDVLATQLDLARAYVETNRKILAKKILDHVIQHGSNSQQQEARALTLLCE